MGLVSNILDQLDTAIGATGESYFENTANALGPTFTIMMTLLLALLGITMALGISRLTTKDAWQIGGRIILIYIFAFSWNNFGAFYQAITETTGSLAMSFFTTTEATISGPDAAMDQFSAQMSDAVDGAARSVSSIMRGMVAAAMYVVLSILMAVYVLVVGFSKIMVAFLLGVAPLAICATIFERTKNLFEAWLSAFVGYSLYPVAAAGIIGTIVSVANAQFVEQGSVDNLSMLLGFFVVVFVGIFALKSIPQAASNLTGQFNLASIAPESIRAVNRPLSAASSMIAARAAQYGYGAATGRSNPGLDAKKAARSRSEKGAAFNRKMKDLATMRGAFRK